MVKKNQQRRPLEKLLGLIGKYVVMSDEHWRWKYRKEKAAA